MATGLLAAALLILLQAPPAPAEQAARQLIEEAIRLEKTPGLVLLPGSQAGSRIELSLGVVNQARGYRHVYLDLDRSPANRP